MPCRTPAADVGKRSIPDFLVVGSQIASLTPGLSFAHNLGCKRPNGSCKAILDIDTSRPLQWHKKHSNARRFDPWNWTLNFWESRKTPTSHFWECGFHPHTYPKVGLRHQNTPITKHSKLDWNVFHLICF
jgi:hypothetical protein